MLLSTSTLLAEKTFCRLILQADTILCKEMQRRNTIFNDFPAFSGVIFNWNQVKCKNIDHTFVSLH